MSRGPARRASASRQRRAAPANKMNHDSDPCGQIGDVTAFDRAVEVARQYVSEHPRHTGRHHRRPRVTRQPTGVTAPIRGCRGRCRVGSGRRSGHFGAGGRVPAAGWWGDTDRSGRRLSSQPPCTEATRAAFSSARYSACPSKRSRSRLNIRWHPSAARDRKSWSGWASATPMPRRRYGDREVLAAIIFVATTGCTWQQLPPVSGPSGPTAHRRFTEWSAARVWAKPHRLVLDEPGSRGELDWSRCAIDSVNMRALKGGADGSESCRPGQERLEDPLDHRADRSAPAHRHLRCEPPRQPGAQAPCPWHPSDPLPARPAQAAARHTRRRQGLRLRRPAPMAARAPHPAPHPARAPNHPPGWAGTAGPSNGQCPG